MPEIPLTHGRVTVVDDEDYALLSVHKWRALLAKHSHQASAVRRLSSGPTLYMHRVITNAQPHEEVDHINGNRLDNRRSNLRKCTRCQNSANKPGLKMTHGYKGVTMGYGKYIAVIMSNRRWKKVHGFSTAEDAARAYDEMAKELHGEFAYLNFPDDSRKHRQHAGNEIASTDSRHGG